MVFFVSFSDTFVCSWVNQGAAQQIEEVQMELSVAQLLAAMRSPTSWCEKFGLRRQRKLWINLGWEIFFHEFNFQLHYVCQNVVKT